VGGPLCSYCAAHNTQFTFLALIDSTWTERRKAVRRQVGAQRAQVYTTLAALDRHPRRIHEAGQRLFSTTTTYSLSNLIKASLLVYRDLPSTYCEAPLTSTQP
jgi:hypothetical protein